MKKLLASHHGRARTALVAVAAAASLVALSACSSSGAVDPDGGSNPIELRVASYLGTNIASVQAAQRWTDLVTEKTDGEVTFEWHLSESLLPTTEILAGTGSGTVDLGLFSHGYHPAELPLTHAMMLGFLSMNSQAVTATMREYYENDEALRAEWDAQNVRPIIFGLETSTILGCNTPIEGPEDMSGKNVRSAGLITEDFTSIDANVVALTAPDMLDGFERGVIDCWSAVGLALANDIGLTSITEHVYDYGRGNNGAQELIMNNDVWESLTDDQRAAMEEAQEEVYEEYFAEIQPGAALAACDVIKENGGTFSFLSDEAMEEWGAAAAPANEALFYEIAGDDKEEWLDGFKESVAANEDVYSDFVDANVTCAEQF